MDRTYEKIIYIEFKGNLRDLSAYRSKAKNILFINTKFKNSNKKEKKISITKSLNLNNF
jgi:hypothetical protein